MAIESPNAMYCPVFCSYFEETATQQPDTSDYRDSRTVKTLWIWKTFHDDWSDRPTVSFHLQVCCIGIECAVATKKKKKKPKKNDVETLWLSVSQRNTLLIYRNSWIKINLFNTLIDGERALILSLTKLSAAVRKVFSKMQTNLLKLKMKVFSEKHFFR